MVSAATGRRYIWAPRIAFTCAPHWEMWNDNQILTIPFLWENLAHDFLGRGKPLSVEAQVAVGLCQLGHGKTYVTISHMFRIEK
ncbi:hypothetical protein VP01_65g8 [Puccinia sorghi]|uniref:Uncharacterized protein n=1 Tax=Puccinia sorghi TaxID=27349 RepID=A0A0L6UG19_9BASI|nr:hypothetical protein VP01_65g8 [Puccinia sorghi]